MGNYYLCQHIKCVIMTADEAYAKNEILPEEILEEFIQQLITRIEEDKKGKG